MADDNAPLAGTKRDVTALCKRSWWVFLIGGIAAVAFGILAFARPGIALLVLSIFFAASVFVDGAVNAWAAVSNRDKDGWWIMLLIGLLGIGVGAYALFNPPLAMAAFVLLVGFMAVFLGVLLITLGYKVRKLTEREWLLYVAGVLSVIFGLLIAFRPLEGSLSVVWLIASWSIVIGIVRILFALKVRNLAERAETRLHGGTTA
jgi:uncharacterized membrane protein HdeD (DUF308 family)